jgi:PAS domain S-box-containing protein
LSHILDSVPGMITRVDRDGRLVFVNRAYVEMMQRPAEALIGRALRELLLPADFARLQPYMDRVMAGQVTAFSRTHHLADGGVMELEGRLVPEFDENGRVYGWIAIFHDATEAQRARALLAESEARFRQLTMLSSDWYWEQDEQLRFTFMSAGLEKHTGMKAQEHYGTRRWDLPALNLSEDDWARHREQLGRHEPFRDFEMQRPDRQGRLHWVSISGDPVFDEKGRFRGYRGVGRDVTDIKSAAQRIERINEELEERVEARTADLRAAIKELDAFTYSVSHDLRAPVGAIAGFTHLLRSSADENLSADGRRLLGFVEQNATRMVGLIEGLLRFARLGREDLRRSWLSMNELAGEALLDFAEAAAGAEIRVGELPECHGDRALIGQVWANLVGNALKYARGRRPARVEIGWDEARRAYFVRDNGVGFDMAYAGKLFGVFERLHRESEFEGSGIGLAIAERIVKRHGGAIWAEAQVDAGATFWFTVPDTRRAGPARRASPAHVSTASEGRR